MQTQTVKRSERPTEAVTGRAHHCLPSIRVDAQAPEDGRRTLVDGAGFVDAHESPAPVEQLKVIDEVKWQAGIRP